MLFDEITKLLTSEIELLKDVRSYEIKYLHKLKDIELRKEKIVSDNKEKAKKFIEELRKKELQKAKQKINADNKSYENSVKKLKKNYSVKKVKLLEEVFEELKKEAENVST